MTTPDTPFATLYAQWLDSFRAMIPGGAPAGPSESTVRKQEQAAANQEWEAEGGCVKPPEAKPGETPVPKLPA